MSGIPKPADRGAHATTREAMLAALERQRAAHLADGPAPAETRTDRLDRAIALLVDHQDAFMDAVARDFGRRSKEMGLVSEVMSSVRALKHARKRVRRWMRPDRRSPDFPLGLLGARAEVHYQPKGVVGVISPWNFPVYLTFGPLAGVLSAGNRAMLKPSEHTPETSSLMARLFTEAFDPTEISAHLGGPDVGAEFAALPFDHLVFTGGTATGRHVMRAAAENLVPVTLELGGKSPAIVGRSAALPSAARRIALAKMVNGGQMCVAPDYVLVPAESMEAFAGAIEASVAAMYPTLAANPDHTSLVNEHHYRRIAAHLDALRERGVAVREINPAGEGFGGGPFSRMMPLFLALDPPDDLTLMQEEIFGPILVLKGYGELDEAIAYVNARPRPLALYYFGDDRVEERRVLAHTTSGGVTLNDVGWHVLQEDLPFGGIGASGMGAYHGRAGFLEFSHAKSVFRQTRLDLAGLMGFRPPYGRRLRSILRREIRK